MEKSEIMNTIASLLKTLTEQQLEEVAADIQYHSHYIIPESVALEVLEKIMNIYKYK